jgi:hypothetical protein
MMVRFPVQRHQLVDVERFDPLPAAIRIVSQMTFITLETTELCSGSPLSVFSPTSPSFRVRANNSFRIFMISM